MPAPQVERLMKAAGRNCRGHQDAAWGARVRAVQQPSINERRGTVGGGRGGASRDSLGDVVIRRVRC